MDCNLQASFRVKYYYAENTASLCSKAILNRVHNRGGLILTSRAARFQRQIPTVRRPMTHIHINNACAKARAFTFPIQNNVSVLVWGLVIRKSWRDCFLNKIKWFGNFCFMFSLQKNQKFSYSKMEFLRIE